MDDIEIEETLDAISSGVKQAFPEMDKHDVIDAISDGISSFLSGEVNGKLVVEAMSDGVKSAFWQMITNATDAPCQDFYDAIARGVKEAILEIGVSDVIKKAS